MGSGLRARNRSPALGRDRRRATLVAPSAGDRPAKLHRPQANLARGASGALLSDDRLRMAKRAACARGLRSVARAGVGMEQSMELPVIGDGTGIEPSELIHREELQLAF